MHLSIRDIDRMADMDIKYIRKDNSTHVHTVDGVDYISFDKLDRAGVVNAFSTRIGGVSEGYLGSMNLSFHRGDDADLVMENHRRLPLQWGMITKSLCSQIRCIRQTYIKLQRRMPERE